MKKVTNQELLARIEKLEKQVKEILDSFSCVKENLESRVSRVNEPFLEDTTKTTFCTYSVDFQYIYPKEE